MERFTVMFMPDRKEVSVERGEDLLSAAIKAGVAITSSCGGDGVCGRCRLVIERGTYRAEPTARLTEDEKRSGLVLACLTAVEGDLMVSVPESSRLDTGKIREEDSRLMLLKGLRPETDEVVRTTPLESEVLFMHSPLATKVYVELPRPTLEDAVSDLERLYREIRKVVGGAILQTGLTNIRRLGALLREADWKVTALLGKRDETTEIVSLEPGNTSDANYGVAFDIGTTTIVGALVDLTTEKTLGTRSTLNRQVIFGDDVITRIVYASEGGGLERLHRAVIDNMNEIIRSLAEANGIKAGSINAVLCAGNTTMMHLLLRVDPSHIRMEPYVSTANFVPTVRAAEVGLTTSPRGLLACVPGVATYVGGDIVAGVVASGLCDENEACILIDIGTNGEVVLGSREWMVSAAASAGPAFEGSGVTSGMRATTGAVQRVRIVSPDEVAFETIGGARPRGICGSGYIDALAELFLRGMLGRDGTLSRSVKSSRLRPSDLGYEFVLVPKDKADAERDIVITDQDIENLKRSKAAIYSAASALVSKMGLRFSDLSRFFIAGGFGTYLDIEKAVTIGLLPDIDRSKFRYIGNSSLVGAREALLSYEAFRKAEQVAKKITYVDLSTESGYMDEYVQALFFPHTDLARFASVNPSIGPGLTGRGSLGVDPEHRP